MLPEPLTLLRRLLNGHLSLTIAEWQKLMPLLRHHGLSAVWLEYFAANNLLPAFIYPHYQAACRISAWHERRLRWELMQLERVLKPLNCAMVLLKGGAYVSQNMPWAKNRLVADVDILVHQQDLSLVEQQLINHGWCGQKNTAYDQHYYRDWSHELPPMYHPLRGMVVDIHHNLLPPTGRITMNADCLWQSVQPLGENHVWQVLCPAHQVIHAFVHVMVSGEYQTLWRDLHDLAGLLDYFSVKDDNFWLKFSQQAQNLGVQKPIAYGLDYLGTWYGRRRWHEQAHELQPISPWQRALWHWLLNSLLTDVWPPSARYRFARFILASRAHWLRMRSNVLMLHLWHKLLHRKSYAPSNL